jgi:hypothetical protein
MSKPKMKKCATCKEEKPLEAFGRNRQAVDGLHYYCKTCAALRQRAWATSNPSKIREAKDRYLSRIRDQNAGADPYQ